MKSFVPLLLLYSSFTSCAAQRRIINGEEAKDGQFPYYAQVMNGTKTICGASIIHKRWVLSAAHCFEKPIPNLSIIVGTNEYSGLNGQKYLVENVINHENYWGTDDITFNDIALIRVKRNIAFSEKVKSIELPKNKFVKFDDSLVTIPGLGYTNDSTIRRPYVLRYMMVEVISLDLCRQKWPGLENKHLCTSNPQKLTCEGDSGGPVVTQSLLIGIVTYGPKGCKPVQPDVHARVSSYLDWIKKEMSLYSDQLL